MPPKKEFKEIEKSNEQFKKDEQVRMLIWAGFVAFLFISNIFIYLYKNDFYAQ